MNLYGALHPGSIVRKITDALESHMPGKELADDVTLSCVRRNPA